MSLVIKILVVHCLLLLTACNEQQSQSERTSTADLQAKLSPEEAYRQGRKEGFDLGKNEGLAEGLAHDHVRTVIQTRRSLVDSEGQDYFKAWFGVKWDRNHLYLAARVRDDIHRNTMDIFTNQGVLTVANEAPLLGQPKITAADKAQKADSVQVQHKNYRVKSTLESIVSFPGTLVYLPFKLTFKGLGEIVSYVDEKKVVKKAYYFFTSDDGRRGVLPTYSERTGGGIKFFQRGLLTSQSKLSVLITAGLGSRRRYQLGLRRVQLWHVLSADLLVRYKFLPDEPFFGIGPDTDFEDDRTNFAHKQTTAQVAFGPNLDERFTAKVIVGLEVNSISPGRNKRYVSTTDVETSETLPGLETGVNLAQFQVEVRHDSSNRPVRPRSGGVELLRVGFFQESGGDQFAFWKATLDFSRHFHLFYDRTLTFRVAGEITEPFSDRAIPFYYLSELGRRETIRGFQRGRFRDLDMLFGSAEYRYPIWRIMDAFVFVNAGQVAHDIFNDFSISDLQVGYGVGIQIWGREGVISGLAVGKSKDGYRVYFGLNRKL